MRRWRLPGPGRGAHGPTRVLDDALRGLVCMESLRRFVGAEKRSGHRGLRRMRQVLLERDPD